MNIKEITALTCETVFVDDEDYSYIYECYDLRVSDDGYVNCSPKKKFKGKMALHSMSLHKLLMNPDKQGRNVVVDHKDGNKLKNVKENLRVTSHTNNMRNRKISEGGTSSFKGVDWFKPSKRWRVQICVNTERKTIGYFSDEVAAANCYNYYALEFYGEFALLNDVEYMKKEEWDKFRYGNDKTSKYRGVSLVDGKWLVQIYHVRNIRVGYYQTEVEAAKAYNDKAMELKGSKAKLNVIT